uniref:Secreted protein n=1 Tax=Oryza rufipogon TaxID=4529 RepID=A0A0E0PAU4_ORYRU
MIVLLLSTTVAISPVDEGKCSTKPQRLPAAIGLLWVRKQHQGFWVFQIRKQRKRLALRIRKRPLVSDICVDDTCFIECMPFFFFSTVAVDLST